MIHKVEGYKNGYAFSHTKVNKTNDEMLQDILKEYRESPKGLRCIVCSEATSRNFKVPSWSNSIITINNNISDGCFFINGCY